MVTFFLLIDCWCLKIKNKSLNEKRRRKILNNDVQSTDKRFKKKVYDKKKLQNDNEM